jgi:RND family efflux transporter MFP subunit
MMKRLKVIVIGVVVFGGVVSILLNNRSKINAKSQTPILSAFPVTVATVSRQQLSEDLSLVGTIAANNDVAIVSETQGKVTAVFAKVGDYKEAGSSLIQVDDELKRAEYEKAEVNYERAKKDSERFASLREQHAATEVQKENAWQAFKIAEAQFITARRQYRDTRITTPISGVVSARNVDVGSMVQDKMVVANVVDISTLKVKLNVAELDAFKLRAGDNVEVTTDVYPGVSFRGRISTISAKADEGHTYPVEVTLPNSREHPLRAGMFGRVSFNSVQRSPTLAIPRESLVGSMKQPQVFVVEGDRARLRNIVVGDESGNAIIVLSGLKDGESVVASGQNNLKDSVAVDVLK